MAWCYRACGEVVVLDADMAERIKRYGVGSKIIRPWVSRAVQEQAACEGERCRAPWTWVYSGNLGRAHEWETLLEAQGLIEAENAEIRLLFQGGGPAWTAAKARAEEMGLKRCDWKDYAPVAELRSSLLDCQCCVASQRPAAKGLLWPSKLALLLTLPRPILWVGSQDGAIAGELRQVPGTGVFAPGQGREIADWVLDLRQKKNTDVVVRVDAGAIRDAALEAWCKLVASCNKTRQPSQAPAIAPARKL